MKSINGSINGTDLYGTRLQSHIIFTFSTWSEPGLCNDAAKVICVNKFKYSIGA